VGLLGAVGGALGADVIEPLGPVGAALGAGMGVIGAVGGGAVAGAVDSGAALGGAGVGSLGGGCDGVLIVKGG
jgi:hypothetical protein